MNQEEQFETEIYNEDGVNESIESDGIDAFEEAFMVGYLAA